MFPVGNGSGSVPHHSSSLPAGWTAYTDVKTNRTYYVFGPTGDTQWERPPPPPPPPPQINPTPTTPALRHAPTPYGVAPTTSHSVQVPVPTSSIGWGSNSSQQQSSHAPLSNNLPPPPTLSHINPNWQSKRLRPPTEEQHHGNDIDSHHLYNPPNKRHAPNINTTEKRKCSTCGLVQGYESFSRHRWFTNEISLRSCKLCINDGTVGSCTNQLTHTPTTIVTSAAANQANVNVPADRSKICTSCGKLRAWEDFSKKQWTSRIGKCNECVHETIINNELSHKQIKVTNTKRCSACGEYQTVHEFSKNQWKASGGVPRTCKKCTQNTTGGKNNAEKAKVCSSCQEMCPWAEFSKVQWTLKEGIRKCKPCVEKFLAEKKEASLRRAKDALELQSEGGGSASIETSQSIAREPTSNCCPTESTSQEETTSVPDTIKSEENAVSTTTTVKSEAKAQHSPLADMPRICSKCNNCLPKAVYSNTQWRRRDGERKCNGCVLRPILKKSEPTRSNSVEEVKVKQGVDAKEEEVKDKQEVTVKQEPREE